MTSTTAEGLKPKLLALVAQGQADEQAFIAGLSDAQRAASGTPEALAAKDYVAHIAAWKQQAVRQLTAAAHGETPAPLPNTDTYNAQLFAEQQDRPWDALLADAAQADADLVAAIQACSEADLAEPDRFPWRRGQPLGWRVVIAGYLHITGHIAEFYLAAGDRDRATAVQEAAVATTAAIFGDTPPQGFAAYTLACFYAETARPALALAALRRALALNPAIRAWAPRDQSFAALQDDPAFQALVSAG